MEAYQHQGLPPALRRLDLSWNPLGADAAAAGPILSLLDRCTLLQTLLLGGTGVHWPPRSTLGMGDAASAGPAGATASLSRLDVGGCRWTAAGLTGLLEHAALRQLEGLRFDRCTEATEQAFTVGLTAVGVCTRFGRCGAPRASPIYAFLT